MKDNELIRDALGTEAGGTFSPPVWDGIRERASALRRRRRTMRVSGGGALVVGLVAVALIATGVLGNDDHRVVASPPASKGDSEIVAVKGPNTDDALVVMSAGDGHVVRTLARGVGLTLAGISATADGRTVYFTRSRMGLPCELGEITKVSRDGGPVQRVATGTNPVVSPDGQTLAYSSTATGADPCSTRGAVFLRDLASGATQEFSIGDATSAQPLAWSPDGRRLVIASANIDDARWRNMTIVDVKSGAQTPLALPSPADDATYLPDGRLVVALLVDATGGHRLLTFDNTGAVTGTLFETPTSGIWNIAADASGQFLFHEGGSALQVWTPGGPEPRTLADNIRDAAWLPAAATSEPPTSDTTSTTTTAPGASVARPDSIIAAQGNSIVELSSSDGSVRRVIASAIGGVASLSISPAGNQLLTDGLNPYRCPGAPNQTSGAFGGVVRIDVATGSTQTVDIGTGVRSGGDPIWSPDGNSYAFSADRCDDSREIVVHSSAGRDRVFTSGAGSFGVPEGWDADGRHLLALVESRTGPDRWRLLDTSKSGPLMEHSLSIPTFGDLTNLRPLGTTGRWVAVIGGAHDTGEVRQVVEYDIKRGLVTRTLFTWRGLPANGTVGIEATDVTGQHLLVTTFVEGGPGYTLYRWSEGDDQPTKLAEGIAAADW